VRLPILKKDLTELAAQKRTYWIRFAYALVLFLTASTLFYANIGVSAGAGQTLGRGRDHFAALMTFQMAALFLIVPLLTAGAIAAEKERETLALLLLTTLTPRQIVLQKFASRMTPILSFVFLSFPLLALTYTFGGVTVEQLALGILMLVFTCLELGAFAILCSAWFRTTVQALAAAYVGASAIVGVAAQVASGVNLTAAAIAWTGFGTFFVVACLSFAESVLVGRAFVPHRNYLLQFFRWLDEVYEEMNVLTGGIVLVRDRGVLPQRDPVRWRETRKKSLGTFRYLFRVLVALEFPILFAMQWIRGGGGISDDGTMSTLLYVVWIASVLLVSVYAASVVSEERSRQTLDVLLASPLAGRRILDEKLAGVHRLMAVVLVPFATIVAFEQWWYSRPGYDYLVLSGLTVGLYLPVLEWLGLSIGLRVRNQLTSIIITLALVAGWTCGLAAALPLLRHLHLEIGPLAGVIRGLSPADMILDVQQSVPFGRGSQGVLSPWQTSPKGTAAHFVFYAVCYALLRLLCLRNADRRLGRIPQPAARR
jgi:ABC-type transport system involved in multi-copper enzyme maturation permease subunit